MRMNFNNGHYSNYYNNNFARINDAGALVGCITPNIDGAYSAVKAKRNLLIALIPVCMILFMGGGILFGVTGGGFGPNFAMLPLVFLGFIGFGVCSTLQGVFHLKLARLQLIVDLKHEIEARDKTNLNDLSLSSYIGKNSIIIIIKKLIDTNNLTGYEIIGSMGVAKTELRAKERDFIALSAERIMAENMTRRFNCPNCGAAITKDTDKFCEFCGTRLD